MEQKFQTIHPSGKSYVNTDKQKYHLIKDLILKSLKQKQLTFTDLTNQIKKELKSNFQGSIPWYTEVVKLDLEARKLIQRIPNTKPQLYKLNK